MSVNVLVLHGQGLNCDQETMKAYELARAMPEKRLLSELYSGSVSIFDYDIIHFGGGFHGGDEPNAAAIMWTNDLRKYLLGDLKKFAEDDSKAMLGICNGFQALVNLGFLPGYNGEQVVSVSYNDCGNFRDDWVSMKKNPDSPCIWVKGIDTIDSPIRHGEGKFVADPDVIEKIVKNNLVAVTYCKWGTDQPAEGKFPDNPNGSLLDIAGICDKSGRIFGLMPHPEAYIHPTNHPDFTQGTYSMRTNGISIDDKIGKGVTIFKNGVDYVRSRKC